MTPQEANMMTTTNQVIGQLRSESASREIDQAPHLIQRFERRPGGYDTLHASKLQDGAQVEIRNPKAEIRNKSENTNDKSKNQRRQKDGGKKMLMGKSRAALG
jgi:hypothetical protein